MGAIDFDASWISKEGNLQRTREEVGRGIYECAQASRISINTPVGTGNLPVSARRYFRLMNRSRNSLLASVTVPLCRISLSTIRVNPSMEKDGGKFATGWTPSLSKYCLRMHLERNAGEWTQRTWRDGVTWGKRRIEAENTNVERGERRTAGKVILEMWS